MVDTLEGRSALLTGASSGIGPHIARRLHREGVRLVLSARRVDALRALARELTGARVAPADLAAPAEVEALASEAGPVDVLVANAGVSVPGELGALDPAAVDEVLAVNLRAPIALSRLLLPGMLARGCGHIVLMASMAGQVGLATHSLYSASKFGLRGFGHALRAELRGTGVGVSVLSPFMVADPRRPASEAAPGMVSPERVAGAVLRAITRDRAETTVAPLPMRAAVRLPMAFPSLARFSRR